MRGKDGRVAIIGASMAGLLAARGLADIASEVLVIERDALPKQPEARKGVPQGRHAHALLRAGALIIEDLFPGLIRDLVARGAQRLFWLGSGLWWQFDGYRVRDGEDFEVTTFTRPFWRMPSASGSLRCRTCACYRVSARAASWGATNKSRALSSAMKGGAATGRAPMGATVVLGRFSGRGCSAP